MSIGNASSTSVKNENIHKEKEGIFITKREAKPIRPTYVEFETEEEMEEFIKCALSREKTDSPEMNRMRELMKQHIADKKITTVNKQKLMSWLQEKFKEYTYEIGLGEAWEELMQKVDADEFK